MKRALGMFFANSIGEGVSKAMGGNALVRGGVTMFMARWAMRSFPGVLAMGALALGLKLFHSREREREHEDAVAKSRRPSRLPAIPVPPVN